jgi:outer membrane protein assembly factor BamB
MQNDLFYLGLKGSVTALNRLTGKKIWKTHLKGSGFVMVVLDREMVIAHTKGEVFGLRAEDGRVLWVFC